MENSNCICLRKKCPRHGKCTECQAFHNSTNVLNFCKWVSVTGCTEPNNREVLRAWLKGDTTHWVNKG
jgi:hypothetical protein